MGSTGMVSDFDSAGGFGLIVADEGDLFPFNLHGAPPALRTRIRTGTRVRFSRQASEPAMRATEVTPIEERSDVGSARASVPAP